jgi:hypothetical protein
MIFLHQRSPEDLTDKLSGTLRIKSAVDIGAVKAAFQTLIDRRLGRGLKRPDDANASRSSIPWGY